MWLLLLLALTSFVTIKMFNLVFYWHRHGIPYEPYWIHLYRLLYRFNTESVRDIVRDSVRRYGKVHGSYRGVRLCLVVADVEIAKDVCNRQFSNFFARSFEFRTGDPLWDNALSQLPYDEWKAVRTVMGNCFTAVKMRGMIPKLDKIAKRTVEKLLLRADPEQGRICLQKYLYGYALDSMVAVSFGLELNCVDDQDNPFVKNASGLFQPGLSVLVVMLNPGLFKYIPFLHFPPKETSNFYGKVTKHIIDEKRKKLDEVIRTGTADMLDLHLIAQRDADSPITDKILASQAFGFVVAGLDTVTTTLELVTYMLTIHPDIQDKIRHEIERVLGDRTDVGYEDLQQLKLLEASILETMRMYPTAFVLDRICTRDTEVGGIPIKKGMVVEIAVASLHYDPKHFPEPERFLPERFLRGGEVSSELTAFLNFGDGPKSCVGKRLALMAVEVLLVNLLRTNQLGRCDATPVPLVLKPGVRFNDVAKDRVIVTLTKRDP